MKKTNDTTRKTQRVERGCGLRVHTETVRRLDEADFAAVVGGGGVTPDIKPTNRNCFP